LIDSPIHQKKKRGKETSGVAIKWMEKLSELTNGERRKERTMTSDSTNFLQDRKIEGLMKAFEEGRLLGR